MGIRDGIKELFSSKDDSDYPDSYQQYRVFTSPTMYGPGLPVVEMRVPLCCEKCEKKVRETLEDCPGVKDVICDRNNNRVTVTGFVDPLKMLRRVKKVKPKSDLHGNNTYINRSAIAPYETTRYVTNPLIRTSAYPSDYDRTYYPHDAGNLVPYVRASSYRRTMNRMPSFSRVERYDDRQRDYYGGIRRMPSFEKHRYHDAEYISMGDEFSPSIPETRYVSLYNKRPEHVYRTQVSFSKLPVTNPYYQQHIEHEYNY